MPPLCPRAQGSARLPSAQLLPLWTLSSVPRPSQEALPRSLLGCTQSKAFFPFPSSTQHCAPPLPKLLSRALSLDRTPVPVSPCAPRGHGCFEAVPPSEPAQASRLHEHLPDGRADFCPCILAFIHIREATAPCYDPKAPENGQVRGQQATPPPRQGCV